MLLTYLSLTLRRLRNHPGYAGLNIFTMALGLAVFFALVIVIQYQRSFDGYHANADRICRMIAYSEFGDRVFYDANTTGPLASTLSDEFPEVESATRLYANYISFIERNQEKFDAVGIFAETSLFDIFSFPLVRGSLEAFEEPGTALLTETMAARIFGTIEPIGETIDVQYVGRVVPVKVVGIVKDVPQQSHFTFDLLISFEWLKSTRLSMSWGAFQYWTYVLLADGADALAFGRKLPDFALKHHGKESVERLKLRYELQALTDIYYGDAPAPNKGDIRYVYLFSAIATIILIMGCVNYMNFALAQMTVRVRETGIRKVMGADRKTIFYQFVIETCFITLLAVPAALVLLGSAVPMLNRITGATISITATDHLSTLLIAACGVLIAGVLAGGVPALLLSSVKPSSALLGNMGNRRNIARIQQGIVVFQVVAVAILITGVMIIHEQLQFIQDRPLGYDKDNTIVVRVPGDAWGRRRWKIVKAELLAHPDITHVTTASGVKGKFGGMSMPFYKRSGTIDESESIQALLLAVDEDFIDAMGLELIEGRDFPRGDRNDDVYIINEAMRQRLDRSSVIGHHIGSRFGPMEIIGVVRDFHVGSLHREVPPVVMCISPSMFTMLLARIDSEHPAETRAFIRKTWDRLMPDAADADIFYHDEVLADFYQDDRRFGSLFGVFTGITILIASLGILGFSHFMAVRKTREIGIRKVMGASRLDIMWLFTRRFMGILGVAVLVAWPVAHQIMTMWLQNFVYRVDIGAQVYLITGVLVIGLVLGSISYYTIQAAGKNVVETLRYE